MTTIPNIDVCDEYSDAIDAAHPMNTKNFNCYNRAQEMVNNRHSKGSLVDLANWLLSRAEAAENLCHQLKTSEPAEQ